MTAGNTVREIDPTGSVTKIMFPYSSLIKTFNW